VPKYRERRSAVSAVTARFSLTISEILVAGTPNSTAKACAVMPKGTRNSSRKTSPGCVLRVSIIKLLISFFMIIDYFCFMYIIIQPDKANALLVINAYGILSFAPATSICGILVKSAMTVFPAISLPKAILRSGLFWVEGFRVF
jgi:hypothetical protein